MTSTDLKTKLLKQCSQFVAFRHDRILKTILDIEDSLKEESKSTSGDKHHTGRAMLQIDREQVGNQLKEIEKVQAQLNKVSINITSEVIRLGSLAYTNQAIFFISISVGSLTQDNANYLGVAPNSPMGLLLLGKEKGDKFLFNKKVFEILKVA
jgi:hypothetical protein